VVYFSFQSFSSKRETEIQSVEKLPENLTDERAGSSSKSKIQSESYGGVTTKVHVPKGSNGKELRHGYLVPAVVLWFISEVVIYCAVHT
jgi:hypothetical protein